MGKKGLRCSCGHEQNVQVEDAVLDILCPKCGAWVRLGEAIGLSFGQAVIFAIVAIWLLG